MKKTLFLLTIFLLGTASTFAATEQDKNAADFLATKNIIATSSDYKLDSTITRREMLKVMMNLSGKSIASSCTGKFLDLPSSDWGCKYAEAALANGYISANTNFRPNDSVTNIEGLKMIMQARGIPKATKYSMCFPSEDCTLYDWKDQYRVGGAEAYIIPERMIIFSNEEREQYAKRKDMFTISSFSFDDYKYWESKNITNSESRITLDTGYSIKVPEGFMLQDSIAYSKDFGADIFGTQFAGIQVSIMQGNEVSDSLYDSEKAANFFYSITKNCDNCNIDNYSKVETQGNIYFAIDKTSIAPGMNMFISPSYEGWKNNIIYTAKTVIDRKEATLGLIYIEGEQDEKEMQKMFEETLASFQLK